MDNCELSDGLSQLAQWAGRVGLRESSKVSAQKARLLPVWAKKKLLPEEQLFLWNLVPY